MGSWFPLDRRLVESQEFKKMPPVHRLYLLFLIDEFNLRGIFYKSDLEIAVILKTSIDTVRRARRYLQELKWIQIRAGFLEKGKRPVATTYLHVNFAGIEKGQFFARIHRYAIKALLNYLRAGAFTHKEVLIFFYLCYFEAKYFTDEDFFIAKSELNELSGIPNAASSILKLNKHQIFGKETLLELNDYYHKIKVKTFRGFADPEDNENNAVLAQKYEDELKQKIDIARMGQKNKKPKRKTKKSVK